MLAHSNQAYLGFVGDEFAARYADDRLPNVDVLMAENNELDLAPASLDAIVLVLAYHDVYFVAEGWPAIDKEKLLTELFSALKPGGVVGIVDHAALPGAPPDTGSTLHRIDPALVISDLESAGFELEGESEALRKRDGRPHGPRFRPGNPRKDRPLRPAIPEACGHGGRYGELGGPVRLALLFCLASIAAACAGDTRNFEEASIAELHDAMQRGELRAEELVHWYLDRIEAIDRSGPQLKSVIELNPDALDIADRSTRKGGHRPARAPARHSRADQGQHRHRRRDEDDARARSHWSMHIRLLDAGIVTRLREAGAVLLGKTNLSEWANFRSANSTSGWSGRGGLTRNPYALDSQRVRIEQRLRRPRSPRACAPWPSAPKPTDRSSVPRRDAAWSASSRPSGSSAGAASSRSRRQQDTAGPMARTVARRGGAAARAGRA